MTDQLSAIDRYRAQWKPNLARIAELDMALAYAKLAGDIPAMREIHEMLRIEMTPPRHLPIKFGENR